MGSNTIKKHCVPFFVENMKLVAIAAILLVAASCVQAQQVVTSCGDWEGILAVYGVTLPPLPPIIGNIFGGLTAANLEIDIDGCDLVIDTETSATAFTLSGGNGDDQVIISADFDVSGGSFSVTNGESVVSLRSPPTRWSSPPPPTARPPPSPSAPAARSRSRPSLLRATPPSPLTPPRAPSRLSSPTRPALMVPSRSTLPSTWAPRTASPCSPTARTRASSARSRSPARSWPAPGVVCSATSPCSPPH